METAKEFALLPLLTASILAFLSPIISKKISRIHIPAIVTTIILGIIFGPQAIGLLDIHAPGSQYLQFLAEIGFIFLMFMAGLEIDFDKLLGLRKTLDKGFSGVVRSPIFSAVLIFIGPLILSYIIALFLKDYGFFESPFLFALLLSTISVGVVVPVLKGRGEINSPFGQIIIVGALLADFGTLILFSGFVMLHEGGSVFRLLVYFILFLAFIVFYVLGRELLSKGRIRELMDELAHTATQIKVRGSLAIMLALAAIAEYVGIEGILGGFLAGATVSLLLGHEREELIPKLDVIGYGFFIPLFFIVVGAEFDLASLFSSFSVISLVILLVGIGAIVKIIPALSIWPRFGFKDSLAGGVLIASRLSLCIAVSHIAFKLELITASLNSAVIIMAAVSSTISPIIYGRLKKRGPAKGGGKVIVAGAGRIGRPFVRRMNLHQVPMVIIDKAKEQLDRLTGIKAKFILGDCTDKKVLEAAEPHEGDTYVALTGDDQANQESCLTMKDIFSITKLIARDNIPKNTELFRNLGLIPLNLPLHGAMALENLIFRPALYKAIAVEDQIGKEFFEVELRAQQLVGIEIKKFPYRGDFLIIAIRRQEDILIPHGNTELQIGDMVMFLASPDEREKIEDLFNPDRVRIPYVHDYSRED